MTDSRNMTESNQQNGKRKATCKSCVSALEGVSGARLQSTSCPPNSSGLPLAMRHQLIHLRKNYSLSTLSQNLLVSKYTDKNASTWVILCLGRFPLSTHFYLLFWSLPSEIMDFICISLVVCLLYTNPLETWTFCPLCRQGILDLH